MKTTKIILSLFMGIAILTAQVGSALAAPALQDGGLTVKVIDLVCGRDGATVIVTYNDNNLESHEVEISLETAKTLGFLPEDTKICDKELLDEALLNGKGDLIDPADLIPVEGETKHPVGEVLAIFFDFADYDTIMDAHENGTGFGLIAQALWITKNYLNGSEDDFLAILDAKKTGDFNYFDTYFLENGTPANWGQFKKAMLNGNKKNNLGAVMSDKDNKEDKTNNGKGQDKDKTNNGKGQDKD